MEQLQPLLECYEEYFLCISAAGRRREFRTLGIEEFRMWEEERKKEAFEKHTKYSILENEYKKHEHQDVEKAKLKASVKMLQQLLEKEEEYEEIAIQSYNEGYGGSKYHSASESLEIVREKMKRILYLMENRTESW